jgi:tryptophan synthase alpha chain
MNTEFDQTNGTERIQAAFQSARAEGRAALMPYFTLGFPTPSASLEVIEAIARAGADLIELGIPFSDPLADGPAIQRSTQVALEQGMTVRRCLESVAALRQRGLRIPFLLMGYVNPILAFGLERFAQAAAQAGADGLIIPDLPPEESGGLEAACQGAGLALVHFLAPTSPPERIDLVASRASGFIYLVSLTGVTGVRESLAADLAAFVDRVRARTSLPLAIGFGISTPEQAAQAGRLADGVISGSALIQAAGQAAEPAQAAAALVARLRTALTVTL